MGLPVSTKNNFQSKSQKFKRLWVRSSIQTACFGVPLLLLMTIASCNQFKPDHVPSSIVTLQPRHAPPMDSSDGLMSYGTPRALVTAKIKVQLQFPNTNDVTDSSMHDALIANCSGCHGGSHPTAGLNLSTMPAADMFDLIKSRISPTSDSPMPPGSSPNSNDKALMLRWFQSQLTPLINPFEGYTVTAADPMTLENYVVDQGADGRFTVNLGTRAGNSIQIINLAVNGPDRSSQMFLSLEVRVDNSGEGYSVLKIKECDHTPPVVGNMVIRASAVTQTGVTLEWSQATDGDLLPEQLTYKIYQLQNNTSDSVALIEATGVRVGEDLAGLGQGTLTNNLTGLTAAKKYFFSIIVQDLEGNKTAYEILDVSTAQIDICAAITSAGGVKNWRDGLAENLANSGGDEAVSANIKSCYPAVVPKCVERINGFALRNDYADSDLDGSVDTLAQKQPPEELRDPQNPGGYWIPDNIEQIAQQKGWTSVRYRSRHAGGFDPSTPNLMMVYVPGDKVSPPVKFDRWLNFPLPKDYADSLPLESLDPTPVLGPPRRDAYASLNSFPRTFTMVTQDLAPTAVPEATRVYFQKFHRGDESPTFLPEAISDVRSACVSCHPSGLRAISPLGYHVRAGEKSLSKENWDAVELINRKMGEAASNLPPKWGDADVGGVTKPFYRPEFQGAIVGATKPANSFSRTREFIMGGTTQGRQFSGCYNSTPTVSVTDIFGRKPGMGQNNIVSLSQSAAQNIDPDKVIRAMNCEGCHTGSSRSERKRWSLNSFTSQISFKILVDQSMPFGIHTNSFDEHHAVGTSADGLNGDERLALHNCLRAEFEEEQTAENTLKWLKQESCPE
jgi:hypothetical protein